MSDGWICLHRKFLEWEWYDDHNVCRLFLHCLLRANHADNKWRGITIKKGSFLTSLAHLSEETGLSVQNVRTALKKLELTNEVTKSSSSKNTVITITKWHQYQDKEQADQQADQQAANKRLTTNNNDNNDKQYIELKFKEFWIAYPNRTGFQNPKKPALEKFISKVNGGIDPEEIIKGAKRYASQISKQKTNPQFIAQAVTWLNQERWEDDEGLSSKSGATFI